MNTPFTPLSNPRPSPRTPQSSNASLAPTTPVQAMIRELFRNVSGRDPPPTPTSSVCTPTRPLLPTPQRSTTLDEMAKLHQKLKDTLQKEPQEGQNELPEQMGPWHGLDPEPRSENARFTHSPSPNQFVRIVSTLDRKRQITSQSPLGFTLPSTSDPDLHRIQQLVHLPDLSNSQLCLTQLTELSNSLLVRHRVRTNTIQFLREIESEAPTPTQLCWSSDNHSAAPRPLRRIARTVLLCRNRESSPLSRLPSRLVIQVLNKCQFTDFEQHQETVDTFMENFVPIEYSEGKRDSHTKTKRSRFVILPVKAKALLLHCQTTYSCNATTTMEQIHICIESFESGGPTHSAKLIKALMTTELNQDPQTPVPSIDRSNVCTMNLKIQGLRDGQLDILGHKCDLQAVQQALDLDPRKWTTCRTVGLLLTCSGLAGCTITHRIIQVGLSTEVDAPAKSGSAPTDEKLARRKVSNPPARTRRSVLGKTGRDKGFE
eukprot:c9523_g1_i1.p1 GENE.c9523_g1_i1~~c9523_g1_i1.p1  ORF type:complete len:487 (+),score=63.09 c9523_g1_i1:52-1512(+)